MTTVLLFPDIWTVLDHEWDEPSDLCQFYEPFYSSPELFLVARVSISLRFKSLGSSLYIVCMADKNWNWWCAVFRQCARDFFFIFPLVDLTGVDGVLNNACPTCESMQQCIAVQPFAIASETDGT